jgi:hypothetical protein
MSTQEPEISPSRLVVLVNGSFRARPVIAVDSHHYNSTGAGRIFVSWWAARLSVQFDPICLHEFYIEWEEDSVPGFPEAASSGRC